MATQLAIDLLRCFSIVAETGALSRAADRVGRSQAAVSMQMKRLEEIVGQPLLNRTGRGVSLTAHGERLLTHARRILRSHDDALAELSGRSLTGTLRFGCPDDYADAFLPALLRTFAELHPHAMIEVVCASTPRLVNQLDRNILDLALTSVPLASARPILRQEELVWVGAKNSRGDWPDPSAWRSAIRIRSITARPSPHSIRPGGPIRSPTRAAACPGWSRWFDPGRLSRC